MSENNNPMELSSEDLDLVAGGAKRFAAAETQELTDFQLSSLDSNRGGVSSANIQETDDFKSAILEVTETGN